MKTITTRFLILALAGVRECQGGGFQFRRVLREVKGGLMAFYRVFSEDQTSPQIPEWSFAL